jgi:peptide/nickel transport system ATP-binding protein
MSSTRKAEAEAMSEAPLLEVEDLHVTFHTPKGPVEAVRGVSFILGREKLGIVGESGSGKSQTGRAILGLMDRRAVVRAKTLRFAGTDLLTADAATMRRIRGAGISMILQDPKYSLNPVMSVGRQIAEAFLVHHKTTRQEARRRTLEILEAVRIRDPERVYRAYPHELSGGMGQRVMIAMMMIPEPEIIIADEPTSALDVTVSLQVLAILDDMVTRRGTGLILISHDLTLVASYCDRVLIMYAGRIMESCAADQLTNAEHPYTRGLLNCLPKIDEESESLPTLVRDPSWAADEVVDGGPAG